MKKTLIVFTILFVFAFATPVFAGWPEGFVGVEIADGCYDIKAEIVEWHDANPWGQRSPVGVVAAGDVCVEDGVARLNIAYFVIEQCQETAWGMIGDDETCTYYVKTVVQEPLHVLPFEQGSYIAYVSEQVDGETVLRFEALTSFEDAAYFTTGAFLFTPPLFYELDNRYTRVTWEISKRKGDLVFPRVHKPKRQGSELR
jgi:hypothetical protein